MHPRCWILPYLTVKLKAGRDIVDLEDIWGLARFDILTAMLLLLQVLSVVRPCRQLPTFRTIIMSLYLQVKQPKKCTRTGRYGQICDLVPRVGTEWAAAQ